MTKLSNKSLGFSLVETLLYLSLAAVLMLISSITLTETLTARAKNQTIAEVEQQGSAIMAQMTQTIRNAETITSPTAGNTAATTTLDVITGAVDPTIFDLSSGVIRIKEGAGSVVSLSSSRVTASSLSFYNVSRSSTPGILKIQFTLTHVNSSGRNEYDYAKTFYGTASLRQP